MVKALLATAALAALLGGIVGYGLGNHAQAVLPPALPKDKVLASGQSAKPRDAELYFEVGQFIVPVIEDGRTRAYVLAEITLGLTGKAEHSAASARLPHYRDAVLRALYSYAGQGVFTSEDFDLGRLAGQMAGDLNRALDTSAVEVVLFDRLLLQDNNRS